MNKKYYLDLIRCDKDYENENDIISIEITQEIYREIYIAVLEKKRDRKQDIFLDDKWIIRDEILMKYDLSFDRGMYRYFRVRDCVNILISI